MVLGRSQSLVLLASNTTARDLQLENAGDRPRWRKGFVVRHNYVGSGQGSVCRVVEFAPGGAKFMHRTETLDYAICLKGECDLELDDGRTVPMVRRLFAGGNRIRTIGPALVKGLALLPTRDAGPIS